MMATVPVNRLVERVMGSKVLHRVTSGVRNRISRNLVYVVNYHATYKCDLANLQAQFEFYESQFDLISLDELPERLTATTRSERPALLVTFDDAAGSNFRIAAAVLEQRGSRGVFMVPASFVRDDTAPSRELERERTVNYGMSYIDIDAELVGCDRASMTVSQVRELCDRGHAIGVHGNRHLRLGAERTPEELEGEIVEGKRLLEESLGRELDVFCWIGGETASYSQSAARMIEEAGYRFGFMTCCAPVEPSTNRLQMHRFNIESADSIERVRMVLGGLYEARYRKKRRLVDEITG